MELRERSDEFRILHRLLPTEIHGFTSRIDFQGLLLVGSWYNLNFLEKVWVPLKTLGYRRL